jgi:putative flippase GtrA
MTAIHALGSVTAEAMVTAARTDGTRPARTMVQYARFLVVGIGNAVLDLGLLNLLTVLAPPHDQLKFAAENSVAVACALANSYFWNARWTFRGQGSGTLRQGVLFLAQGLLNLLLNDAVLLTVMTLMPAGHGLWLTLGVNVAKVSAMLVASTTSFTLLRAFVFRTR